MGTCTSQPLALVSVQGWGRSHVLIRMRTIAIDPFDRPPKAVEAAFMTGVMNAASTAFGAHHTQLHMLAATIAKGVTTTFRWEDRDTKSIDVHRTLSDEKPTIERLYGHRNFIRSMILTRLYHMCQHQ